VAAGIAALDLARRLDPYPALERAAAGLAEGLASAFASNEVPATVNREGSMLSVFFTEGPVRDLTGAKAADHERYARLFHHLVERGVLLPPSGYELWTLGTAHEGPELARILEAVSSFRG
jgi:glutamate-1-semialdehyde 2,1-aminomutase